MVFRAETESQLPALLAEFASHLNLGDLVILQGELGAGKTACVRAIVADLGSIDPVRSPTFALIHQYQGRVPILHADLYRIGKAPLTELLEGMAESITLVEWAEESLAQHAPRKSYLLKISVEHSIRLINIKEIGTLKNGAK